MIQGLADILSSKVYYPVSRAYRWVNSTRRPTMQAFRQGMQFRAGARDWASDRKQEWILARLRTVVRQACEQTAFYRERFCEAGFDPFSDFTFEEFARLPVLEREDIGQAGASMRSAVVPASQHKRDSTGGSSGSPTEVWLGPEERGWREGGIETFMNRVGMPCGTRTALLWGHHLDKKERVGARAGLYALANNQRWFDCFRIDDDTLERYHKEFEEWRPACILAYASALGFLAEYLEPRGIRPAYPTIGFVTGAEKLSDKHRAAVKAVFGMPVHERYGSRDVGSMGMQLAPDQNLDYTLDWANVLIEPETDEEESAVLVTKLHADVMPMIRYRVGDIARFPSGARPGHPSFTLHEIIGRDVDRVWLPSGSWIHGNQFPHMLKDYPIREYALIQHSDYSVTLNVVPSGEFPHHYCTRIKEIVGINLPEVPFEILFVDEIPRTAAGKLRPVVSSVEHARRSLVPND